ncbi:hypothetical protein DIS24_g3988 [Lasiodiplodia hormozganensis]|uniref:Alpha-1,2-mannosyltransferase n=1 Tax=Lasiodiplodia hormozganensis TaxID=869390 RepID=A0AA40D2P3_9PEZI|nr:hypothetical protein DIS24_g3988 [Lasiodiplodia hormozganensis]
MAALLPLALALAFLLSTVTYLASNKSQRNVLLSRLGFQGRSRDSGASTPPRSLSPDKKGSNTGQPDYSDTFPPSRRFTLAQVKDATKKFKKPLSQLAQSPEKKRSQALDENILTTTRTVYTATEFSSDEIKALGDFPDYATLSGVPLPKAYPEFDIDKAKAKPYRPFRWAYHQTMSFSKLDSDWWLELESTYASRIKQRQEIYKRVGKRVLDCLPGCELACKELMEMCLQFLVARYPHYFRLDEKEMVFHNGILKTTSDLKREPPLEVIMNNIPEDFAITLRDDKTGYYYLRGGVVCSSLGWDLGTKMGMRLDEIHQPIPDYKEKMRFSMDRYFAKKPTDKAIQRGSWGLEVDQPLYMPAGDPHEKYRDVQDPSLDLSRMNLRVDWQTLRRLPLSGAIVFNFKALFTPVATFRDEPYIPSLVLKICRDGKKSLMEYKNTWHTEHVVLPAMEAFRKEQEEKGLIPKDWEEHTIDEYPLFPGWEEKWHREQGF